MQRPQNKERTAEVLSGMRWPEVVPLESMSEETRNGHLNVKSKEQPIQSLRASEINTPVAKESEHNEGAQKTQQTFKK